jgi:hypothetical protein
VKYGQPPRVGSRGDQQVDNGGTPLSDADERVLVRSTNRQASLGMGCQPNSARK